MNVSTLREIILGPFLDNSTLKNGSEILTLNSSEHSWNDSTGDDNVSKAIQNAHNLIPTLLNESVLLPNCINESWANCSNSSGDFSTDYYWEYSGFGEYGDADLFDPHEPVFLFIYIVTFLLAVVGNMIIVGTILCKTNHRVKSTTYYLLLSLSFSDMAFALMSPIHVHSMLTPGQWVLEPMSDIGCKIYYFVFRSFYAFSVFILMAITIERYIAIKYPFVYKCLNIRVWLVVLVLVVLSFIIDYPYLQVVTLFSAEGYSQCMMLLWESPESQQIYYCVVYVLLYLIPLTMMMILYTIMRNILRQGPGSFRCESPEDNTNRRVRKKRRKMANMLMVLVLAFFLCWTPWNVMECWSIANDSWIGREDEIPKYFNIVLTYTMLPVMASTAINPILYGFMSEDLRTSAFNFITRRQDCSRHINGVAKATLYTRTPELVRKRVGSGGELMRMLSLRNYSVSRADIPSANGDCNIEEIVSV